MVSRGICQIGVLYIVLFSLYTLHCRGSWMWLGITPAGVPEKQGCTDLPLTNKQKDLCKRKPHLLTSIKDGARLGIAECQAQFRIERWNCTITKELSVFGYELTSGTKETAFIYAVMAAGLVHAVTRACSAGNVTECSCDTSLQGGASPTQGWQWSGAPPTQGWQWGGGSPTQGWQWGGCSDDIQYGTWFSRRFFDGSHRNKSAAGGHALLSVNRHNSEAGRQAVAKTMSTDCRCHGISGSCAVRTCWRAMAPFERVGSFLKERYEDSVQVQGRPLQVMRRKDGRPIPIGEEELVFLKTSPSYCVEDRRKGVAGTRGRQCDRSSAGPGGCGLLCCGRGYNTRVEQRVERCECRFVWCCYVRCLRCENISDTHTCK